MVLALSYSYYIMYCPRGGGQAGVSRSKRQEEASPSGFPDSASPFLWRHTGNIEPLPLRRIKRARRISERDMGGGV